MFAGFDIFSNFNSRKILSRAKLGIALEPDNTAIRLGVANHQIPKHAGLQDHARLVSINPRACVHATCALGATKVNVNYLVTLCGKWEKKVAEILEEFPGLLIFRISRVSFAPLPNYRLCAVRNTSVPCKCEQVNAAVPEDTTEYLPKTHFSVFLAESRTSKFCIHSRLQIFSRFSQGKSLPTYMISPRMQGGVQAPNLAEKAVLQEPAEH